MNEAEAKTVGSLVRCLLQPEISMGIITPYQAQRSVISRECKSELGYRFPEEVEIFEKNVMINTVDSFQGQQRDVIIVSTVRANNRQHLGFLTDERRINVTLTRAKFLLVIVGHADTLGSNQVWNDFLNWAETEKIYYEMHSPEKLKEVLSKVFDSHNKNSISRKRYSQFSADIRKKERSEIQFSLKMKKTNENVQPKQLEETPSKNNELCEHRFIVNDQQFEKLLTTKTEVPPVSKYALNDREIQKIRSDKLQKEKEMQDFQAM